MQVNDWNFEIIAIRARKVKTYGDDFIATASITIVDGEAHVEGVISIGDFTLYDRASLGEYIKSLGYDYYISSRFKNGKRVKKKITL